MTEAQKQEYSRLFGDVMNSAVLAGVQEQSRIIIAALTDLLEAIRGFVAAVKEIEDLSDNRKETTNYISIVRPLESAECTLTAILTGCVRQRIVAFNTRRQGRRPLLITFSGIENWPRPVSTRKWGCILNCDNFDTVILYIPRIADKMLEVLLTPDPRPLLGNIDVVWDATKSRLRFRLVIASDFDSSIFVAEAVEYPVYV